MNADGEGETAWRPARTAVLLCRAIVLELIHPDVLAARQAAARSFAEADPFPHLVFDQFFEPAFCRSLMDEFPAFDRGDSRNEAQLPGGKSVFPEIKRLGGAYERADALFGSEDFTRLISDVTGIRGLRYDPQYVGGGTHENLSGQDLDPHIDFNYHPHLGWHRRVNLIIYLNPEWDETWGGAIELHEDPRNPERDRTKAIPPRANTAILFETSERSWHGFRAIHAPPGHSRRSLAIYQYTETRPAEQCAPPHATVYVERPLPDELSPGQPLESGTLSAVERLLVRRRQHVQLLLRRDSRWREEVENELRHQLRRGGASLTSAEIERLEALVGSDDAFLAFLYEREKTIGAMVQELAEQSAQQRSAALPIRGPVEVVDGPSGYWEDGWVEQAFSLHLRCANPISSVTVRGFVPEELGEAQRVLCTLPQGQFPGWFGAGTFEWKLELPAGEGDRVSLLFQAGGAYCPAQHHGSSNQRSLAFRLEALSFQ